MSSQKYTGLEKEVNHLLELTKKVDFCEYCDRRPPTKIGDRGYGFSVYYYDYGDGATHRIEPKYCPMCGRLLNGK